MQCRCKMHAVSSTYNTNKNIPKLHFNFSAYVQEQNTKISLQPFEYMLYARLIIPINGPPQNFKRKLYGVRIEILKIQSSTYDFADNFI